MVTFEINKHYNFSTIAPNILGADYKNLKLVSVSTIEDVTISNDLATVHEQIKVTTGLMHDIPVKQLNILKFIDQTGKAVMLANEWIDPLSISAVNQLNVIFNVKNVGINDKNIISRILKDLGYLQVEITEEYV